MIRPSTLAAGPSLHSEQVVQQFANEAVVEEPAVGYREDQTQGTGQGMLLVAHINEYIHVPLSGSCMRNEAHFYNIELVLFPLTLSSVSSVNLFTC